MLGNSDGICGNSIARGVWTLFARGSTEEDSGHADDGDEECGSEPSCGVVGKKDKFVLSEGSLQG